MSRTWLLGISNGAINAALISSQLSEVSTINLKYARGSLANQRSVSGTIRRDVGIPEFANLGLTLNCEIYVERDADGVIVPLVSISIYGFLW